MSQGHAKYVTRVSHGCKTGYQCLHLLMRDDHVLEVVRGESGGGGRGESGGGRQG